MDSNLDPRAVLAHLNRLGYRNISPEQLKEFIRDLKSLIKYESKYSIEEQSPSNNVNLLSKLIENCKKKQDDQQKYRSHREPTTSKEPDESSRRKRPTIDIIISQSSDAKPEKAQKRQAGDSSAHRLNDVQVENKQTTTISSADKTTQKSNGRKCSGKFIRNTPTDLYQKYKEDWARFKNFLPGENSREDVRQAVHRKLRQRPDSEKTYLCFTNAHKEIKRM